MVYVDKINPCRPTRDWPYATYCHLLADTIEELHEFAVGKLGMKRAWFQNTSKLPHYDLTIGNRFKALKLGAVEIDSHKVREMMRAPYQYSGQQSGISNQVSAL
ncbi:MAG TPA: hypothetical protein DC049_08005 [Spirochaetia bacterium]|nr:hypothetical protein [Spirochaetia bacterium]